MQYSEEELNQRITLERLSGMEEGVKIVAKLAHDSGIDIDSLCNTALLNIKDNFSANDVTISLAEVVNNIEGQFSRDIAIQILQNLKGVKVTHAVYK